MTELLAMQKGLEAFIKEFEADVKALREAFEQFQAKYPDANWYVQVEQEEHDLFDLMDFTEIEP